MKVWFSSTLLDIGFRLQFGTEGPKKEAMEGGNIIGIGV